MCVRNLKINGKCRNGSLESNAEMLHKNKLARLWQDLLMHYLKGNVYI